MYGAIGSEARSRRLWLAAQASAVALVAACGGGGDGETAAAQPSAAPPPATLNVYNAYSNLVRQAHTYTLSGSTSQGQQRSATINIATGMPLSTAYGNRDVSTLTMSLRQGATLLATNVSTSWLQPNTPYLTIQFASIDGSCILRTSGTQLPTSASLGQSGPFLSGSRYPGCNASDLPLSYWIAVGTVTTTWSYDSTSGFPALCINTSIQGFVGTETESDCVEVIDIDGTLGSRVRITTRDLNGVTTTLTN